jgi:hypothetical protein
MSPLYGGASPYNTKDSFKISTGSEMGKPTLCKKRKGWATLISYKPQRVRHPPCRLSSVDLLSRSCQLSNLRTRTSVVRKSQ